MKKKVPIVFKYSLGQDYIDELEEMFDTEPKDRRTKAFKKWLEQINPLIKEANLFFKMKMYKQIK
jgi:hypothetical protein